LAESVTFAFPRDYEQTLECRRLTESFTGRGLSEPDARDCALMIGVRLFRQLAYIPAGSRLGHLHERDASMFRRDCGCHGETAIESLTDAGLLVPVEGGSGWDCPLFIELNGDLDPGRIPLHKRAARTMHHDRRVTHAQKQEAQVPLPIWKNYDGTDMGSDRAKDVRLAIIALDSGLGLPDRDDAPERWPEALIQNVGLIVATEGIDKILTVARRLIGFSRQSEIPRTTEQLAARWRELAPIVLRKP
jgi:hypothetical protein